MLSQAGADIYLFCGAASEEQPVPSLKAAVPALAGFSMLVSPHLTAGRHTSETSWKFRSHKH